MARTDKDTPLWAMNRRPETSVEIHDHTRSANGYMSHCCTTIAHVNGSHKKHWKRLLVTTKSAPRFKQHRASGACKKFVTVTHTCDHNVFGDPMNPGIRCDINSCTHAYTSKWDMRCQGYSWHEIKEWSKLNGICFTHEVTYVEERPNAECKCDAWFFYNDCTRKFNATKAGHGHVGMRDQFYAIDIATREASERTRVREMNRKAKYIDWRDELTV